MTGTHRYAGSDRKSLQALLRDAGFRSTEGRLALLSALKRTRRPLSVGTLALRVGSSLDEANVYRALQALTSAGIAARVDFRHGHAHYEFRRSADDHHHLVCTRCDAVEDVRVRHPGIEKRALGVSRSFARVLSHSLEFFGVCTRCAKS